MTREWLGVDGAEIALVAVSAVGMLLIAIAVIRVNGLRSLAKMSSFDFVVTIALGSIVATVVATSTSLWTGAFAFAALLALQWIVSQLRRRAGLDRFIDNTPILLMVGADLIHENLDRARVTEDDVRGKLREANVTHLSQVLVVVFEATGDISVLHGSGPLDERLLEGVEDPPAGYAVSGRS